MREGTREDARESTVHAPPRPGKPVNLGEWCVLTGAATAEQVRECLDVQRACHGQGKPVPRLGEILVARGYLTPELVADALADQGREIMACPRCRLRVNVSRRADALGFECARCHGPLEEPSDPGHLSATDHAVIVRSRDPVPPEVTEAALEPANVFGKYVLLREIGRGGMGQVFLAWDTFLCQKVALKRVRPDVPAEGSGSAEGRGETLIREARHAIRLRHPGIVSVFDVGREGDDFYISMEYVEGRSLDDELRRARLDGFVAPYHRDPEGTLRMLAEVARALHYAHTSPSPVVHCDLKPGNIMVDAAGAPHLLDFGLARRLGQPRTKERDISGTPNYMSPEQASGWTWEIDARTDVYGLGAVLYEMMTGRPPFMGDPLAILGRAIHDRPASPSRFLDGVRIEGDPDRNSIRPVPSGLEELCLRCLEKEKDRRPQSMLEVAELLGEAAREFRPGPPPAAIAAPARKRRPLFAAAVLAAFALGAALAHRPRPAPTAESDRAAAAIGLFRPEAVTRMGGVDASLREEAGRVAGLRDRILRRLERTSLAFEELRLRERTLRGARVTGADARGLDIRVPDLTLRIAWSDLEPSQVLRIARECGAEEDGDGLLALGIFSLRAGRRMDAKEYFEAAKRGPHRPIAERYLASR